MNPIVPVLPESAPFTIEQRAWLNGFLAGLFSRGPVDPVGSPAVAETRPALQPLTILFGSQTGTAESLAKRLAKDSGRRGFAPMVRDMAGTTPAQLAQEANVLVVTSTYGEGEPPDNAKALHRALGELAERGPAGWSSLRFSVCALGDSNYVHFCECGRSFDALLEKLGARRVTDRAECDVDYEARFAVWSESVLNALASPGAVSSGAPAPRAAAALTNAAAAAPASAGYSRAKPFPALVLTSRNLNGAGSAKQVHHVEFDLGDSGLAYEAGDALGVYPHNCPELVDEVLTALGCDGEEAVPGVEGGTVPLRLALKEVYELGRPSPELLELVSASARPGAIAPAPGDAAAAIATTPHHVLDALLPAGPGALDPVAVVRTLRRIQPRLYSISSSPKAQPGRVHVTVGAVRYEKDGRGRKGVCSTFLADRVVPGSTRIPVFVHSNRTFRPPGRDEVPMIMIGPGTGIAPFRAFLQERRARGARGRNWLFFGDQRAATDFLYRDELEAFRRDGVLARLDTAFSRDQDAKVYVQHRMLERAAELYAWLEEGAHVYVCGDASRMAKDVDAALHALIQRAGGRSTEQAVEYVDRLRSTKRYCRDVY